MTVGMLSEVRQLLLSVRKLNLCDTCLLSSRKLACIVLKHRMEMLQCLLSKSRLCLCISVEICVNGLRLYYVWQISMHRRWHFYLKGMRKWQEVDSRKEGTWHLLRASSMPDCGLHACFVLGRGENFFLNSQIKSVFKKDRLMGLTSRTLLGKISFWWPKLMGENSNLGTVAGDFPGYFWFSERGSG